MKHDFFLETISENITFSRKRTLGNASYAYHRHDACEVVLFYEGDIRFYIEQTCFTPSRGSLVVLNPNEMHRIQSMGDAPYERIVLNIKKSYLDELSTEEFNLADCFYKRPLGKVAYFSRASSMFVRLVVAPKLFIRYCWIL